MSRLLPMLLFIAGDRRDLCGFLFIAVCLTAAGSGVFAGLEVYFYRRNKPLGIALLFMAWVVGIVGSATGVMSKFPWEW
jgi:hypothetical protein